MLTVHMAADICSKRELTGMAVTNMSSTPCTVRVEEVETVCRQRIPFIQLPWQVLRRELVVLVARSRCYF